MRIGQCPPAGEIEVRAKILENRENAGTPIVATSKFSDVDGAQPTIRVGASVAIRVPAYIEAESWLQIDPRAARGV